MKKIISVFAAGLLLASAVSAYNPPAMGEDFYELSSSRQMANAYSSAGGGIFYEGPDSILINPALSSGEQRVVLNLANTELFAPAGFGDAFQLGIIIPFKWAILTGYFDGVFTNLADLNVGNSMNFKASLAKGISDKFSLGLGLNSGVFWGYGNEWSLSANIGGLYEYGDLAFMKDVRFAAVISNLGKVYTNTTLTGVKDKTAYVSPFPQIGTLQIGAAGLLLKTDVVKIGASLDLTTPLFQNLIVDTGVQFSIKDVFVLSVAEKMNITELACGRASWIPSVGFAFKFDFNTKMDFAQRKGWNESEMTVSASYKNFYNSIHGISEGVDLYLGMPDKEAPVINIIFEDDGGNE